MLALAAVVLAATTTATTKKVLVIGVDGCRPDALIVADTPYVDALVRNGCYTVGKADPLTVSGPCWSSVLCGVWARKHGVIDNSFRGANYDEHPDFLSVIETVRPLMRTVSVASWRPINEQIVRRTDHRGPKEDGDVAAALEAADQIARTDADVVFVHLGSVDGAGHTYGYSPDVPQYITAIEEADKNVGLLVGSVGSRPTYRDEDWLIILTSDHGGTGKSHGLPIPEHIDVPFVVSGPSAARAFSVTPTQCDIAPTVFAHLGISPPVHVDWDGVPVGLKGVDSAAHAKARDRAIVTFYPERPLLLAGDADVHLSVAETGAEIGYTLDGTVPIRSSGARQRERIDLSQTTLVRARAFREGKPIGPSSFALYKVQESAYPSEKLRNTSAGLSFSVVQGKFGKLDGIDFSRPVRKGATGVVGASVATLKENFAVRFEGYLLAEGTFVQFFLTSDDGSRLWIGDKLLIDNDGAHGSRTLSEYVALQDGWHKIRIDYIQASGDAHLSLMYRQSDDEKPVAVPPSRLAHVLSSDFAVSHSPYWSMWPAQNRISPSTPRPSTFATSRSSFSFGQ